MIQIIRRILRWLIVGVFIILLMALLGLFMLTQSQSQLQGVTLNPFTDIKMLNQLRQDWISTARPLNRRTEFILSQMQLNKALAFQLSAQQATKNWQAVIKVQPSGLNVDVEVPINLGLTQRYLPINIQHTYNQWQQPLTQISLKWWQLPQVILSAINRRLADRIKQQKGFEFIQKTQLSLFAEQDQLVVQLVWIDQLQQRFSDTQTHTPQRHSSILYAAVVQKINQMTDRQLSLTQVFSMIAQQQLSQSSTDSVSDFWLVAAAILGDQRLVNLAGLEYIKVNKRITLNQRVDLAQHFTYSGFLEHNAGSLLANTIGTFKEQQDAKNKPTKFSYSDSAANQAGIYFAVWLEQLQQAPTAIAALSQDSQIMIDVSSLAEGIELPSKSDYQRQIQVLKNQIQSLPFYQR